MPKPKRTSVFSSLMFSLMLSGAMLSGAMACFAQQAAHPEMLVSTEWLAAHLNDPGVVVVQIGEERKDYDQGHIPGTRFLSTSDVMVDRDGKKYELPPVERLVKALESLGISNSSRVVIYSTDWPPLAARGYFTLDYLGLGDRAALLDGGLEKWKMEKRELSQAAPKITVGNIHAKPRPELVADIQAVEAATGTNAGNVIVLDSRPDKRYLRAHIPGAIHVYWNETVNGKDTNELLQASEIKKVFDAAGAKPGSKVLTYCEVGWQASHAYFTAKYLGYDVALYDGSFQEWNDLKHLPVVKGASPR
jgi:thiosulfate/3-mercaptopyruvate sulfurtransferase